MNMSCSSQPGRLGGIAVRPLTRTIAAPNRFRGRHNYRSAMPDGGTAPARTWRRRCPRRGTQGGRSRIGGMIIGSLRAAREGYDAVVKLTRRLMRVPSRGGIDPFRPVLECMSAWLSECGLACRRLAGPGEATVALTCEVPGGRPGPRFVLDTCLDTAPFADETAWAYPRSLDSSPAGGCMAAAHQILRPEPQYSPTSRPGCATRRAASTAAWCCWSTWMSTYRGFGGAKAYFQRAGPVDGGK